MNIGRTIHMFRKAANMTQEDLANRAGISNSYLSLIERNKREPMVPVLVDICNALDTHILIFFFVATKDEGGIPEDVNSSLSVWAWDWWDKVKNV